MIEAIGKLVVAVEIVRFLYWFVAIWISVHVMHFAMLAFWTTWVPLVKNPSFAAVNRVEVAPIVRNVLDASAVFGPHVFHFVRWTLGGA